MKLYQRVMRDIETRGLSASKRLIKGNLILVNGFLETNINMEVSEEDKVRILRKSELKNRENFKKISKGAFN